MKVGDIVECVSYGAAIILGPCQIPRGVPEEARSAAAYGHRARDDVAEIR